MLTDLPVLLPPPITPLSGPPAAFRRRPVPALTQRNPGGRRGPPSPAEVIMVAARGRRWRPAPPRLASPGPAAATPALPPPRRSAAAAAPPPLLPGPEVPPRSPSGRAPVVVGRGWPRRAPDGKGGRAGMGRAALHGHGGAPGGLAPHGGGASCLSPPLPLPSHSPIIPP